MRSIGLAALACWLFRNPWTERAPLGGALRPRKLAIIPSCSDLLRNRHRTLPPMNRRTLSEISPQGSLPLILVSISMVGMAVLFGVGHALHGADAGLVARRAQHHTELRSSRSDFGSDALETVGVRFVESLRNVTIRVFDERAVFETQWTCDPFGLPPVLSTVAFKEVDAVEAGETLQLADCGYGRKLVEIEGVRRNLGDHGGAGEPVFGRGRAFVHEGLGGNTAEPEIRSNRSRRVRFLSQHGEQLSDREVFMVGETWGGASSLRTDRDGVVALDESCRFAGVESAPGRLAWFRVPAVGFDDRIARTHDFQIADRRIEVALPGVMAIAQVAARIQLKGGATAPLLVGNEFSCPSNGVLAIDVPAPATSLDLRVLWEDGSFSFGRASLDSVSEAAGCDVAWSDFTRGRPSTGSQWTDALWLSGEEPSLRFDHALAWSKAVGERLLGEPGAGWPLDSGQVFALDPSHCFCVARTSNGLPEVTGQVAVRTLRAFDCFEAARLTGASWAKGYSTRFAEAVVPVDTQGLALVSGLTWSGHPTVTKGLCFGHHDTVGVQDKAPTERGSGRADMELFLVDELGRPLDGASVIAQYYPGGRSFRHRRGKLDLHGYARLTNLPTGAAVDLLLRDPSAKRNGVRRFMKSSRKRLSLSATHLEPVVWILPSGTIDVTLGGIGSLEGLLLEVTVTRDQAPDASPSTPPTDDPAAERPIMRRTLREGDDRIKLLGLENGSYQVAVSDSAGEVLWEGAATVAMNPSATVGWAQTR